jgi:hypothetical protein
MKSATTTVVVQPPVNPAAARYDKLPDVPTGFARIVRWWCNFTATELPRNARRSEPFRCYIGDNGAGKTASMIRDIEPELDGLTWECFEEDHAHCDPITDDNGDFVEFGPAAVHTGTYRVLSTVRIYNDVTGKLHEFYEQLTDWRQLDGLEHAVLVLDEITGVAHSRESSSLPSDISNRLMQMRKCDVSVLWSAPAWARAEKIIREVTKAITVCVGGYPSRQPGTLWKANRRFLIRTYSTVDFDEWSAGKKTNLVPLAEESWWGPGSRVFNLYRTKQAVTRIGHANEAGICVNCGGTRRRAACSCAEYTEKREATRPPRGARVLEIVQS